MENTIKILELEQVNKKLKDFIVEVEGGQYHSHIYGRSLGLETHEKVGPGYYSYKSKEKLVQDAKKRIEDNLLKIKELKEHEKEKAYNRM